MIRRSIQFAGVLLAFVAAVKADDVVLFNATGGPGLIYDNARILDFADEQIRFINKQGTERTEQADRVFQIRVSNDPVLTAGENARVLGEYDAAIRSYQVVVRGKESWKIRYAAPRLLESAKRANRFDGAVSAFVALVGVDPALAARAKPSAEGVGRALLDEAVVVLADARKAAGSREAATLLALELDVHRARGDADAVTRTIEQLVANEDALLADPGLRQVLADIRIGQAEAFIAANQPGQAVTALRDALAATADDDRLSTIRRLTAETLELIARRKNDRPAWQDAALAHLAVVAHAPAGDTSAADALLRAGRIHESQLSDPATAARLYRQVVDAFAGTPAATTAARRLAEIGSTR